MHMERALAAREALETFEKATAERRRAKIMAITRPWGASEDITEDVVTIMDQVASSMEWGSGFFSDEDLGAFIRIAGLLKIDLPENLKADTT